MTTSVGPVGAPTLAIAGSQDVVHPSATVRQTAARLGRACEVFLAHEPLAAWRAGLGSRRPDLSGFHR